MYIYSTIVLSLILIQSHSSEDKVNIVKLI